MDNQNNNIETLNGNGVANQTPNNIVDNKPEVENVPVLNESQQVQQAPLIQPQPEQVQAPVAEEKPVIEEPPMGAAPIAPAPEAKPLPPLGEVKPPVPPVEGPKPPIAPAPEAKPLPPLGEVRPPVPPVEGPKPPIAPAPEAKPLPPLGEVKSPVPPVEGPKPPIAPAPEAKPLPPLGEVKPPLPPVEGPKPPIAPAPEANPLPPLSELNPSVPPVAPEAPNFVKPIEETPKTDDLLNAVPKPDMMISSPDANSMTSDDLIEDYVGNNYDKISKRVFNLPAFFFNGLYFAYRKMILESVLISLIVAALLFAASMVNLFISLVVLLVSSVILCFVFNKLYISTSKKKIDDIKNKNKAKSVSDLKRICAKKGGTNIVYPLVVLVGILAIFTTIINNFFPEYIENIKDKVFNTSTSKKDNNPQPANDQDQNVKPAGQLNYVKTGYISDKIDVGFLTIFKATENNADSIYDYEFQTVSGNENSYCKFNIGFIEDYDSSITLINELANNYEASQTITPFETPTNLWNTFTRENDGDKETYAAATSPSNEVVLVKYTTQKEANENLCKAYYSGILNSVKFK